MAGERKEQVIMVGLLENFMEMVFPTHCHLCSRESEELICKWCRASFRPVEPPLCKYCGTPVEGVNRDVCEGCRFEHPPYDLCRSVFYYDGAFRESIKLLKFKKQINIAPHIIDPTVEYFRQNEFLFPVDVIVPVPSNPGSKKYRDYNPSAIFGRFISRESGVPVIESLQFKRTPEPQHELDYSRRWKNIQNAFQVNSDFKKQMAGKKILLVDDIITTGATVTECSKTLLNSGAKKVFVFSMSRSALKGKEEL